MSNGLFCLFWFQRFAGASFDRHLLSRFMSDARSRH
jgi:hypothetical protein